MSTSPAGFLFRIILAALMLSSAPAVQADEQADKIKKALKALLEDEEGDEKKAAGKKGKAPKIFEPAPGAEFSFVPFSEIGKDIYPSIAISLATVEVEEGPGDPSDATVYGDKGGSIGVLLRNVRKGDRFVVEISADAGFRPSKTSFVIKDSEVLVAAFPKIRYDFDALARNRQNRPINVTFKVTRNDKVLDEVDETWTLRQINDCPLSGVLACPKRNGKVVDEPLDEFSYVFAAFVNENHPWVDLILKEAKDSGSFKSFHGYQGTEDDVMKQVGAIWTALQRRNITYTSIADTVGSKRISAQHVRFLDESISSTQANCVDGSVMIASVLRKLGIHTYLVLVPGHCYVAFALDEEGENIVGLETTMLGSKANVRAAVKEGTSNPEHGLHPNIEKFLTDDPSWVLIDVNAAREAGISPLPYVK